MAYRIHIEPSPDSESTDRCYFEYFSRSERDVWLETMFTDDPERAAEYEWVESAITIYNVIRILDPHLHLKIECGNRGERDWVEHVMQLMPSVTNPPDVAE